MQTTSYGIVKRLAGVSLDDAHARVRDALVTVGFGILTEIDVKTTLKTKLDVDFRPYTIFGACNPQLAHRALEVESHIGLLLPCNIVVQETAEGSTVSVADPQTMFSLVDNRELEPAVREADERLRRVLEALD